MTRPTRSRRGASAVEFALSLPVLLVMLTMIGDGCIAMLTKHALSRAVRDGARVASSVLEPIPATGDDIEAAAVEYTRLSLEAAGVSPDDVVIAAEWVTATLPARVEVSAGLTYEPLLAGWSPFDDVLVQRFTMITVEQP